jgi:hypothetical protein
MRFLVFIFLVLFNLNSYASISIVSDLDDTIKITNSGEEIDGAINAFFKDDTFTGIPEFFSMARIYTNELHVLSASPKLLRHKITSTLNKKKIKFESLILKDSLGGQSKFEYKVAAIKRLMEKSTDDFILIGDDVGQDPEAYEAIRVLYPNRVLAIYIHMIKSRPIPNTLTKFWTSFELFLREYSAGRMLDSGVDIGAKVVLDEINMKFIIPSFANCPANPAVWSWQLMTPYALQASEISKKVSAYCLSRNSSNN